MAAHPWLEPIDPSFGEQLSDRDSPTQAVLQMPDQSMRLIAPDSFAAKLGVRSELLHPQLPTGRTEGSEATRNIQAAHLIKRPSRSIQ